MAENPNIFKHSTLKADGFDDSDEIMNDHQNRKEDENSKNLKMKNKEERSSTDSDEKFAKNTDLSQSTGIFEDGNKRSDGADQENPSSKKSYLERKFSEEKEFPQNVCEDELMSDNSFARALFGVVLKPTKKPSGSNSSPEQNRKNFLFGSRKKVSNSNSPLKTKYSQPKKVDKIDPDPRASYPMDFVLKLRSGKSRHQRGYLKEIEPLSFDTPKPENHTRFVCVSDTHNEHNGVKLPEGDVLLHCGDFTLAGRIHEVDSFNEWLGEIPFEHKIVIAGNHELSFDPKIMEGVKMAKEKNTFSRWGSYLNPVLEKDWQSITSRLTNCTYLEDCEVTINGIRIWGSPWQPKFGEWGFNVPRGKEILAKWDKIPGDGIDILMTHGPPVGHGDKVLSGMSVGCVDLLNSVQLRVQPKFHLFGHIHEAYGITTDNFTTYINCSSVNYNYRPVHKPIIFDLPNKDV